MLPWGGYLPGLALANSHGWGREAFLVSLRIAQGAVMWITYANLGIGIGFHLACGPSTAFCVHCSGLPLPSGLLWNAPAWSCARAE
jgi:hypothetical protein